MTALTHNLNQNFDALVQTCFHQEQVEAQVIHRFGPGIYIREALLPAGSLIIGHTHKTEHTNIMIKGRLLILHADGTTSELVAPACFTAKPGRKIAVILEDVIWQNVYATTETDVRILEELFLDKTDEALPALPIDEVLMLDYTADEVDFIKAITEFGFSIEQVKEISDNVSDQMPFPEGAYKCMLADSLREGVGLFATSTILKGEIIAPARLGDKRTPAGRYTNHSRKPNAMMQKTSSGDIYLIALQNITGSKGGFLGDEITIDYRQALLENGYKKLKTDKKESLCLACG